MDTAAQMLALALPAGLHAVRFCSFLGIQTEYKVISADQWLGFLRFNQEAWPTPRLSQIYALGFESSC